MSIVSRNASRVILGALLLGMTSAAATATSTTTATSTFQVTANVLSTCSISAGNLDFGNYSGLQKTATSTITVACTQNQGYDIGLDGGTSGSVAARKMGGPGGDVLGYGLYEDANYDTNWGNTVGTDTEHGNGSGSSQTLTIYGKLPAGELVEPGSYSDTITATITY